MSFGRASTPDPTKQQKAAVPAPRPIGASLVLLLVLAIGSPSLAQTYRTGAVGTNILKVTPTPSCTAQFSDTWYEPAMLTLPSGSLSFVAQTGRTAGSACTVQLGIDSIYQAQGNPATNVWTTPSASACPTLAGASKRCQWPYTTGTDGKIRNNGPIGAPSVIKVGSMYYMLFNGGNSDYITGKLYWAKSTDGVSWSVYTDPTTGKWAPILAPRYHECELGGINEPFLAFVATDTSAGPNGTFYILFNHEAQPDLVSLRSLQPQAGNLAISGDANGAVAGTTVRLTWRDVTTAGAWTTETTQDTPDANGYWSHQISGANNSTHHYDVYATYGTATSTTCTYPGSGNVYACPSVNHFLDTWSFRLAYDPTNAFGLGGNRQIWHNGTWKPSSGSLIWWYDVQSGKPSDPTEPTLTSFEGKNPSGAREFGSGDLKQDPVTGQWLLLYEFNGVTYTQTATSLATNLWTAPATVNMSTVTSAYPQNYTGYGHVEYEPGLWYGASGPRTGWWIYDPVNFLSCPTPYVGLGITNVEMCSAAAPSITGVSPNNGASAGGTSVTLTGTSFDCASAVTLGGSAATIVSKSPTSLSVTTPAHAAGAVNVAVTTPGGTATLTNGFTYTAPPIYEGFDEALDCNVTSGWAWDKNRPNDPITVSVYDGTTLLGSTVANAFRQDLVNAGKGNGFHGYGFSLPSSIRTGSPHSISVKFGSTTTQLTWSPRSVTCQP